MHKIILTLFIILTISACSPVYKKHYSFSTPPTEIGKMCANGCLDKKATCVSNCKVEQENCRRLEYLRAENRYLEYVTEQKKAKKPIEKTPNSFRMFSTCGITSCKTECNENHRICYSTCGGKVKEKTYCTKFCD